MACGTPVLAFRRGSVPEVIDDGVTGRVVDSEEEAVAALPAILAYDRRSVRRRFEERFTAARMAEDYLGVYRGLLGIRRSNGKIMQGARPQQLDRNGSNGPKPVAMAEPLLASLEPDPNSEVLL
jgi:Glycosyl transferases group 1